jgi:hypothetical protein
MQRLIKLTIVSATSLALLVLVGCGGSPPNTVIREAVEEYGSIGNYGGCRYQLKIETYKATNHYTRKIEDEVFHFYDVDVTRSGIPRGSLEAFIPSRVSISLHFVKRGKAWYYGEG